MNTKYALAVKDAALWKSRFRCAQLQITLFKAYMVEDKLIHGVPYYYTAAAHGPKDRKRSVEIAPGRFVEYKHTAKEWLPIWEVIAEKLHDKSKVADVVLESLAKADAKRKACKRNCPNCIYCYEIHEKDAATYKVFCESCGHWLEWVKDLNCKGFIAKDVDPAEDAP